MTGSSTRKRAANWAAKISVYPSRLDLPPTNKSLTWAMKSMKLQIFEKYSKSFSWLKHLLANESLVSCEKSLCWTRNWACDWFYLRLSRQNRAIQFLKFLTIFAKTKYFPKTTKHSKIFLWLINKDWACENTFNQVQSHEWLWHSLNIDMCGYQKWDSL